VTLERTLPKVRDAASDTGGTGDAPVSGR
jgi:hypothetical protein